MTLLDLGTFKTKLFNFNYWQKTNFSHNLTAILLTTSLKTVIPYILQSYTFFYEMYINRFFPYIMMLVFTLYIVCIIHFVNTMMLIVKSYALIVMVLTQRYKVYNTEFWS